MARTTPLRSPLLALGLGMALLSGPACALYKVVGPDGKVSYTDRPDTTTSGRITGVNANTPGGDGATAASPALPAALRQVASKFPVVLYVSDPDCEPCNSGRQLLQQRGIPHTERSVTTNEDVEALQRLTGGKSAPTLTIGGQALRGFSSAEWGQYLDAAGYPAKSALPVGYKAEAAKPLVPPRTTALSPAPRAVNTAPNPGASTEQPASADPAAAANPPGIRF